MAAESGITTTPGDARAAALVPEQATARMADGIMLRTLRWQATGDLRARTLLVHGLGEHAGRYGTVADALTAAGHEVHGYDHRGFGGSAGRRAWVERWTQLHDDLEARVEAVRAERPEAPLVLYGHSMGGLIALGYVLADTPRPLPDVLVLSAPGLDDTVAAWKHLAAGFLGRFLPRVRIRSGLPPDGLSSDPSVRVAAEADPLCLDGSTAHFGAEAFAEQDRVRARIAGATEMPVPTYVLHGADDPVVPVAASEPLGRLGRVTRRVHEGLRHECHHEPSHAAVLGEVVAWVDARLAELPAAPAGSPRARV